MYGIQLIDMERLERECKILEDFLGGYTDQQRALQIVHEIEGKFPFMGEKTGRLERLIKRKRIDDKNKWNADIFANIQAIINLARIQNVLSIDRIEKLKRFRVELSPSLDLYQLPFRLHASVYVNDRYHGSVSCVLTETELRGMVGLAHAARKRRLRMSDLMRYLPTHERSYTNYIEKCWLNGIDLTKLRSLTWKKLIELSHGAFSEDFSFKSTTV